MAVSLLPVDVDVQTFYNWVTATNTIINTINTVVVTANSAGSITTGNAIINGVFAVNTGVVGVLQGGELGTPATLNLGSNVDFLGNKLSGNNLFVINVGTVQSLNSTHIVGNNVQGVAVTGNQVFANTASGNNANFTAITGNTVAANTASGNNASFANIAATALLNVAGAFFSVNSTKLHFNGEDYTSLVSSFNISNNGVLIVSTANLNIKSPDSFLIANVVNNGGNCDITFTVNAEGTVAISIGASVPNTVIFNDGGTPNGHVSYQFFKANTTVKMTNVIVVTSVAGGNHSGDRLTFTGPATLNATTSNSMVVTTNVNANQLYCNSVNSITTATLNVATINTATMNAASANIMVANTLQTNNLILANTGAPVANNIKIDSIFVLANTNLTWNLHSWGISTYRAAEYLLTVSDQNSSSYQSVRLMIVHDGTTVKLTEYALLATNAAYTTLSSFDADINVSSVTLKYVSGSTNTIVQGVCTRIAV